MLVFGTETYIFRQAVGTAGASRQLIANVTNGNLIDLQLLESQFIGGVLRSHSRRCAAPCSTASVMPNTAGTGVVLKLNSSNFLHDAIGTNLTGADTTRVSLTGTLEGDWPGAYVLGTQLPMGASANLRIDGVAQPLLYTQLSYLTTAADPLQSPVLWAVFPGTRVQFATLPTGSASTHRVQLVNAAGSYSAPQTASAIASTDAAHTVTLSAVTVNGAAGVTPATAVLDGTLTITRNGGRMVAAGLPDFVPLNSTVSATDRKLQLNVVGIKPLGALMNPNLTLVIQGGQVHEFQLVQPDGTAYQCAPTATAGVAACSGGITLAEGGRSIRFDNLVAGRLFAPATTATFSGTLVIAGR